MERRESIIAKKERISKGPKHCLGDVLLEISKAESSSNPNEMLEWAVAFSEYFDEHPEEWGEVKQSDPPLFREFKGKIENFLDLFRKARP